MCDKLDYIHYTTNNRLLLDDNITCIYCKKIYFSNLINNYTDNGKTALCYYCGIDAIVPFEIENDILEKWHEQGFGNLQSNYQ